MCGSLRVADSYATMFTSVGFSDSSAFDATCPPILNALVKTQYQMLQKQYVVSLSVKHPVRSYSSFLFSIS